LQFELRIGDAAEIHTKRVRKQKTDRQDAQLLLKLLMEDRFPRIWVNEFVSKNVRQAIFRQSPIPPAVYNPQTWIAFVPPSGLTVIMCEE
jgi:hypothetical protein